ncbi:MAG: sugar phosphate nucleotidyltransferase, partial [Candidatus Marinimicrobia bacterium]|nr:sugar phosphate nucleotidyltransferase [Candidatus Neomarinimicrobiota bacterium]
IEFAYATQETPRGIADAFIVGKKFIGKDNVCLMLGDNIFYGHGLPAQLQKASEVTEGAIIFAYAVKDPERYGVVEFDKNNVAIGIEEKPLAPRSKYAVPGIYFYDNQVVEIAENLKPSGRGELEITDVNNVYIEKKQCKVEIIGRGTAWLDAGTHEALLQASNFVQAIQERQGILIASPEEVAYRMGYIDFGQLQELAGKLSSSPYGQYLLNIPETI